MCPAGPPKDVKLNFKTSSMNGKFFKYRRCEVLVYFIICVQVFIASSCKTQKVNTNIYENKNRESLDYNNLTNWAAHPLVKDLSDSLSDVYKSDVNEDLVDIFFLHPTTFTDKKDEHISNADINDEKINRQTDNSSILYQSSVFNQVGRIYAPRYRQAHIHRYYMKGEDQMYAFQFAYEDVREAFKYYMKYYNNGRPIIIAGHSQGTTHAIRLLKELIDNHIDQGRVVNFFLIGMPVKKNEFKVISPCAEKEDLHCYYSWRTYRRGYKGKFVNRNDSSIQVNNPVETRGFDEWSSKVNKGKSILWNYNIGYDGILKSKVQGNMLWISRPTFPGGILGLFMKNYHAGDINLFYGEMRSMVRENMLRYYELNSH
jgi:hypothetical protein